MTHALFTIGRLFYRHVRKIFISKKVNYTGHIFWMAGTTNISFDVEALLINGSNQGG